ncbi:hypothetical protein NQ317_018897 [Molorchus minor]|uniref:Uncharacterized protein n=1 Tax=Molorchus minor TaxID=1323400 RepID=A0ABQ9IQF3_9CUCU|nr:hypothetical protein NQ317_018897 [Molorchus minor]
MTEIKNALRKSGFIIGDEGISHCEESIPSMITCISDNKNIGGVIIEFDINKAITYLKEKTVYLSLVLVMPDYHSGPMEY